MPTRSSPLKRTATVASVFALLASLASGCGASFDGTRLHKRQVDYRVGRLPASFARVRVKGNDLAFYEPKRGTIAVNATCQGYDDVPPVALLNQLLFGTTERHYLVDEQVTLDGRGAQHCVVDAELDGVPLRMEVYLLTRAGCVFDLSYLSDRRAEGHEQFTRFVQAFEIERVGR